MSAAASPAAAGAGTGLPTHAAAPAAIPGGGAPLRELDRLVRVLRGARGALRAGREVERLMALSDEALARTGLTRDGIVAHALRRHLPD